MFFPRLPLLQTKWADFCLHSPKAVLNPPKLHVRPLLPLQSGRTSAKAIRVPGAQTHYSTHTEGQRQEEMTFVIHSKKDNS